MFKVGGRGSCNCQKQLKVGTTFFCDSKKTGGRGGGYNFSFCVFIPKVTFNFNHAFLFTLFNNTQTTPATNT